jgi:tetratricopeptide (TPR) repeat protein
MEAVEEVSSKIELKKAEQLINEAEIDGDQKKLQAALDILDSIVTRLSGKYGMDHCAMMIMQRAIFRIGIAFQLLENYKAALSYLGIALAYRSAITEEKPEDLQKDLIIIHCQILACRIESGEKRVYIKPDIELVDNMVQQMISSTPADDFKTLAEMYHVLGFLNQVKEHYEDAEFLYHKTLFYSIETGDTKRQGLCHFEIAQCNLELGLIQEAKAEVLESLTIFRRIGDEKWTIKAKSLLNEIKAKGKK